MLDYGIVEKSFGSGLFFDLINFYIVRAYLELMFY